MEQDDRKNGLKRLPLLSCFRIGCTFALTLLFFLGFFFPFLSVSYVAYGKNPAGEAVYIPYRDERTLITVFQDGSFTIFGIVFVLLFALSSVLSVLAVFSLIRKKTYSLPVYSLSSVLIALSGFFVINASVLMIVLYVALLAYSVLTLLDLFSSPGANKFVLSLFLISSIVLFFVAMFFGVSFTPAR